MNKKFFALGLMLAVMIAGVTWAHQSASRIATRVETAAAEAGGAPSVSGRVTAVDVSEGTVTIDVAPAPTEVSSITAGDEVQIQLATDAVAGDGTTQEGSQASKAGGSRRLLGLWLLAMTGTTVVLRSRRPRTI